MLMQFFWPQRHSLAWSASFEL